MLWIWLVRKTMTSTSLLLHFSNTSDIPSDIFIKKGQTISCISESFLIKTALLRNIYNRWCYKHGICIRTLTMRLHNYIASEYKNIGFQLTSRSIKSASLKASKAEKKVSCSGNYTHYLHKSLFVFVATTWCSNLSWNTKNYWRQVSCTLPQSLQQGNLIVNSAVAFQKQVDYAFVHFFREIFKQDKHYVNHMYQETP